MPGFFRNQKEKIWHSFLVMQFTPTFMQQQNASFRSLVLLIWPVFVYKIVYAVYIIYYAKLGIGWYRLALLGMAIGGVCALVAAVGYFRRIRRMNGKNKEWNEYYYSLFVHTLILVLYIVTAVVHVGDSQDGVLPQGTAMIILMGLPPVLAFVNLLISDNQ